MGPIHQLHLHGPTPSTVIKHHLLQDPIINCITYCSSATCSNPFNSNPYPSTYDQGYIPSVLIYFNSEVFISSEPYSVTRTSSVTWSNTFNSDDLLSQRGSMSSDPCSVTMTCSVTWSNPFNSDDLPHI